MSNSVTLGGNRLGSGTQMKVKMHGYDRSNCNLTKSWRSSMATGVLTPCYVQQVLAGDIFEIRPEVLIKTLPTIAPLFGKFKFQVDYFQADARLYQAILHNNPTRIGLNMSQVKFPKIRMSVPKTNQKKYDLIGQTNSSSLLNYLGIKGMGTMGDFAPENFIRDFNAMPLLAYYDIFKNYYANKQEDKAYGIGYGTIVQDGIPVTCGNQTVFLKQNTQINFSNVSVTGQVNGAGANATITQTAIASFPYDSNMEITENGNKNIFMFQTKAGATASITYTIPDINSNTLSQGQKISCIITSTGSFENSEVYIQKVGDKVNITVKYTTTRENAPIATSHTFVIAFNVQKKSFDLIPFELSNIDDMRMKILSNNKLGQKLVITEQEALPYSLSLKKDNEHKPTWEQPLSGLLVKTYQSDFFNNWINTDFIDGEQGISEITAVSTAEGKFTVDSLVLANKVYNMLNRIAVSGATYQDWQQAVYGVDTISHKETPIYLGGTSGTIVFQEIISAAPGEGQPTGTLSGTGRIIDLKGGYIKAKVMEAGYIIGIVSITPIIEYSQGNKWFMTDIDSPDDFHKPELDGIGFQDLITEQMHFAEAIITGENTVTRFSAGKQPSWTQYRTDIDENFGDFAAGIGYDTNQAGAAYMVLGRNYELNGTSRIKDLTTYIDPEKWNYPFAVQNLTAQNFWVQIKHNISARRKISARLMPNL